MSGFLAPVVGGFSLGILLASFSEMPPQLPFLFFLLGAASSAAAFAFHAPRAALRLALLSLSFGTGLVRFEIARTDPALPSYVGTEVALRGVIDQEPETAGSYSKLVVTPLACCGGEPVPGFKSNRILVEADQYASFRYGDEVIVEGRLSLPKNFANGDGRSFDYVRYLAKDKILYVVEDAEVAKTGAFKGSGFKRTLFGIKAAIVSAMDRMLPYPHSGVLSGVTLGTEGAIGKDFEEDLRRAGLIHMIVLSGYNVTLVAEGVMRMLSSLPRGVSFAGGTLAIVLFAIMTGGTATVVRASVMALVALLARGVGREYGAGRALFVAGSLMVFHNPYVLAFDMSFQLSFLATLGIVFVTPLVEPRLSWLTPRFKVRELVATTLSTQIAVVPLILYSMGDMSLLSLPANMLVLPVVPAIMGVGALGSLVALVSLTLALPFSFVTYLMVSYVRFVVEAVGSLPFASIHVPPFPSALLCACYAALAVVLVRFHVRHAGP